LIVYCAVNLVSYWRPHWLCTVLLISCLIEGHIDCDIDCVQCC